MIIKKFPFALFIILFFCDVINAQDVNVLTEEQLQEPPQTAQIDTFPLLELDNMELDNILSLREQLEKLNQTYSSPTTPNENLLRFLKKDELELSPEALYLINWVRDPSTVFDETVTFKDTVIVNPLFLPPLFKGGIIPADLELYDKKQFELPTPDYSLFKPDTTLFRKEVIDRKLENMAYDYIRLNYPEYFRYSQRDLPTDIVKTQEIKKNTYEPELIQVEKEKNLTETDAPVKFLTERRYWTSHFESSMQFAQAYFSPNWHAANQNSNVNFNTRNYFRYDYNKNKVRVTNELELRLSANNAPKDTVRSISFTDNNLRLHSNFGYQAFNNKWYYSFDADINSKLVNTYNTNDKVTRLTGFLAPVTTVIGVGMNYSLNKKLVKKNKYNNLSLSAIMSPLSLTHRYSRLREHFDFGRHGFDGSKVDEDGRIKNSQTYVGSDFKINTTWRFNKNTTWVSFLNYNTSYHRIIVDFQNRVELTISRFFSTQINLNLRFDDLGKKNEDLFDSYLQMNESLTFGFSYKW